MGAVEIDLLTTNTFITLTNQQGMCRLGYITGHKE